MPIENKGQFNQVINASLERNKSGKIEGGLVKITVSKLMSIINNATIVDEKDSNVIKQSKEKLAKDKNFQQEIYNFILRSALSKGTKGTEEYHASNFDKDKTKGLSEYEMNQWTNQLNNGILKILEHGSISEFQSTEIDIKNDIEDSKFNPQFYVNKLLDGSDIGTIVSEDLTGITGEEVQKLLEAKWGDQNFMKGLGFAVLKEGTQSIQDVLVFFSDILAIAASGGYVLTQYGYYRTRYELSDNPEYKAKMEEMAQNHPLLGLANMLTTSDGWSKLSDLIGSFGDLKQLTAQKIAIGIATIIGLIGGGIGLAKGFAGLTSRFASKLYKLEKSTKAMVRLRKVSMGTNKISRKTGKVVEIIDGVVDPLGNITGKGLGVVVGKVSELTKINEGTKNNFKQKYLSGSANDITDTERLSDAQQLLGIKLTIKQQHAIIKAHNIPMGNNFQKGKILRDSGFTDMQTRDLMEAGVCGWFDDLFAGKQNQGSMMKISDSKPETELIRIQTKIETLNMGESIVVSLGGKKIEVVRLTREESVSRGLNPNIEFFILDRELMRTSSNSRGYKGLRPGEKVTLGRNHLNDRFDYTSTTSKNHVSIERDQSGKVIIKDLNSSNGTFIEVNKLQQKNTISYDVGSWVIIPRSDGSTSRARILLDIGNSTYRVGRTEGGKSLEKIVSKDRLDKLNKGVDVQEVQGGNVNNNPLGNKPYNIDIQKVNEIDKRALQIEDKELLINEGKRADNFSEYKSLAQKARNFYHDQILQINSVQKFEMMQKDMHKLSAYKGSEMGAIGEFRRDVKAGYRPSKDQYASKVAESLGIKKIDYALLDNGRGGVYQKLYVDASDIPDCMKRAFDDFKKVREHLIHGGSAISYRGNIAGMYWELIKARPFGNVNNSLFMNQVNYLLKKGGMNGIYHGNLDHLAVRFSKDNFIKIFEENYNNRLIQE